MENESHKSDVNGAGDTKSEEDFLSAIIKFSKKRQKISAWAEFGCIPSILFVIILMFFF